MVAAAAEGTPAAAGAQTGAPAATPPATGGAPPGSPFALNWDSLGEDDQIIEHMRAEHAKPAQQPAEQPAPKAGKPGRSKNGQFQKGDASTSPSAGTGNEQTQTASGDPAENTQTPSASQKASFATPDEALAAVVEAFEAADLDKLAKLTGKPRAFFEAGDAKWAAFREEKRAFNAQKAAHAAEVTALETRRNEIEGARQEAAREYGAAIRAAAAYRAGDYEKFADLIKELTGDDYDTAQANVIQGALSTDPVVKRLRTQLTQQQNELAELKKKTTKTEETQQQTEEQQHQAARQRAVAAMESDIGNHEVKKIKGYTDLVFQRVRDSWDGKTYTLSFLDAADELVDERAQEAAALGFSKAPAQAPAAPAEQPRMRTPSRNQPANASAPGKPKWETEDLDDDELIASINADYKAGRLK